MTRFEHLTRELSKLVPFRIRYKDESEEMEVLSLVVEGFCPDFMSSYTTVIGSTVYFPNRHFVHHQGDNALRILSHEAVHLLDAERWSMPGFMLAYLFPQILAIGIFLFPWMGIWALLFLLFLLPLPAPFRFYFESRAYAIDVLTAAPERQAYVLEQAVKHFSGWGYYRMFPFEDLARKRILSFVQQAENGQDNTLIKVLLLYEMVYES